MATPAKPATTRYIRDEAHYAEVLLRAREVKSTLWIGTADLKDVFVMRGKRARPFLGEVAELIEKGVSVRLIHAKEPGPNFRKDFDRYPILATGLERVLCPRVHFKLLIFDLQAAYVGSANLTGAGIGMKSDGKRNFEAGIWTDDPQLVSAAIAQFDSVWMGAHCEGCRRKAFCGDSIL
jgi:phosphatidylserine/phosphatidylglycerophosphate/cardiolipin synthase-like enzyme